MMFNVVQMEPVPIQTFHLSFLLKHYFYEEWLDTFENLPTLVHVVIWADMLPVSQLVSLSGPFAFLHMQNIYFLTGLGHCLLKTSHLSFAGTGLSWT